MFFSNLRLLRNLSPTPFKRNHKLCSEEKTHHEYKYSGTFVTKAWNNICYGMVKKLTIVNTFVLRTLHLNIPRSVIIKQKTTLKKVRQKVEKNWLFSTSPPFKVPSFETCQREQVNKILQHFLHATLRVNKFLTV